MGLWKSVFGESQEDVWRRVADVLPGRFETGGLLESPKVHAELAGFNVVLDIETVSTDQGSFQYTRLRAPFINAGRLRFGIGRTSVFSRLGALFGAQDIAIGVADFDRDFVIKGNDEARIRLLLSHPPLRAAIAAQPGGAIAVLDNAGFFGPRYGADVDVLEWKELGVIKDEARLVALFHLVSLLLQALRGNAPLEVPPAELLATFGGLVDAASANFGAVCARVGDAFEIRADDVVGAGCTARLTVTAPSLPAMLTTLTLTATLPPSSSSFAVAPRGRLSLAPRPEDAAFHGLEIEGDAGLVARLLPSLRILAPLVPVITTDPASLTLTVSAAPARAGPAAASAALELWSALVRHRAGL